MELTFLGTASAYPTPTRGVSCIVFRHEGTCWMFDCGEGSQIQLMKSHLKPGKISKIFITHLHGDHLFGLPGLLCTISQNFSPENKETVQLFGPEGLRKFVRTSLELSRSQLGFNYVVHELQVTEEMTPPEWQDWPVDHSCDERLHPNEQLGTMIQPNSQGVWNVCEDRRMHVQAGWLKHKVPTFGYILTEKPLPGKLDAKKLQSLGIPPGPLYAKIKAGQTITSPTGEQVAPGDVLGPEQPGRRVVILGDTCDSSQLAPLCRDADVIVHEATLENNLTEDAENKGHSTPGMAGEFARSVGCRQLILTHFSQRYKPQSLIRPAGTNTEDGTQKNMEEDHISKLVDQAKEAFRSESVIAVEDLVTVTVAARKT